MNSGLKEFLIGLQEEMLTQDTIGQADPRFWVIRQKEKIYGIDDDYSSGEYCLLHDGEEYGHSLLECIENLKEQCIIHNFYATQFERESYVVEVQEDETLHKHVIHNLRELHSILERYSNQDFQLIGYREEYRIMPNTMFLTLRECKEHLRLNHYHYNNTAHPYAMTAWRSPQVEQLYKIIQTTDWSKL